MLLVRAVFWLLLWIPVPAALVIGEAYGRFVANIDAPGEITGAMVDEQPSRVVEAHGLVVGGPIRGRRAWVPFADLSPDFVRAAIASEDARFFEHDGFDPRGLARAVRQNLRPGDQLQGGSGITQQLAKSFVGTERTIARKLVELVVARRIEAQFSKDEIFSAWANRAFFGGGATGIGAAAELFFAARPSDLTLAQSALLVALIPAPSRYDPRADPELAMTRRNRVLARVEFLGLASAAEVAAAQAEPIVLGRASDRRVRAEEIERAAFREASALLGTEALLRSGLTLRVGVDLARQRVAQRAMTDALLALDRRQGLREHLGRASAGSDAALHEALAAFSDRARLRPVLVETVDARSVTVSDGQGSMALGPEAWSWALPWTVDLRDPDLRLSDARAAFEPGDIVLLGADGLLSQRPRVEGAAGSADLASGALEAVVGGYDPAASWFDRFTQGCRQPGSTFKPIVYSVAIDSGVTVADVIRDTPVRFVLGPFEEWRPRNADGRFSGHMTVWEAFVWSRNLPVLALFERVGARAVIERARRLGIFADLAAVQSLALGASCLPPSELLAAYGTFARQGLNVTSWVVEQVERPDGSVLWTRDAPARVSRSPARSAAALWSARADAPARAMSATTAFTVDWLMREAVLHGTAMDLRDVGFDVAGKTGTTNAYDAWFAGFSGRDVAVVWIGADDNLRPLGIGESGGSTALPAWRALVLPPDGATPLLGPVPRDIVMVDVDPESGFVAAPDGWSRSMPFLFGSEPRRVAPTQEQRAVHRIHDVERRF